MKTILLAMLAALAAGILEAADPAPAPVAAAVPVVESDASKAGKAMADKVLAVKDNEKAAELLTAEIRAMYKDNEGKAAKDGVPETTLAWLVKTDFERARVILPILFANLTEGLPLEDYERLVAAALLAAEANAYALTESILNGLEGKNRWIEAVMVVAKDTPRPLPTALAQAIRAISATVLPPAVIPPGPEPPPPPPPPPPPYEGQ